nr:uncharacterized protein LOC125642430 isoform X1 [Caretta caretta]
MRRNYLEESRKLISFGCCAHLMHLLAKDFSVPQIKANVVEIAKYFRINHFAVAALKKVGGTKLTVPQDVRWNSVVDCFEHYIKNWPNLLTVCEQSSGGKNGTITAQVLNIGLKRNVEHMPSTLKPISVALNKMQGNRCFIADGVEIWKEPRENLKREICNDRVKLQALKKKRMGQALPPAHFLVNNLNTRHQGQTLTAEEKELAMTWTSSNHLSIMPTIINFRAKSEPFKKCMFDDVLKKVTSVNWWKSLKHLDSETAEVMISLLTAVASSGVERLFSSFGLIHSKLRNCLGSEKAGKLIFLFQIMNKQENEGEDD